MFRLLPFHAFYSVEVGLQVLSVLPDSCLIIRLGFHVCFVRQRTDSVVEVSALSLVNNWPHELDPFIAKCCFCAWCWSAQDIIKLLLDCCRANICPERIDLLIEIDVTILWQISIAFTVNSWFLCRRRWLLSVDFLPPLQVQGDFTSVFHWSHCQLRLGWRSFHVLSMHMLERATTCGARWF